MWAHPKNEIAEENSIPPVFEKKVCLVVITFTSPKASVTTGKQIPSKEKWGLRGFKNYIESTFLIVRLTGGINDLLTGLLGPY